MSSGEAITALLERHARGDGAAMGELLPIVYEELRRLARSQRRRMRGDSATLDTTALVHEAYLRFARSDGVYAHRGHFFAVAAAAMRQLIVDEARHRRRAKRGGGERPLTLGEHDLAVDERADLVLAVDEALARLEKIAPRLRAVVELRYFLGLSEEESAAALGVTDRTVRRDWTKARAWLQVELAEGGAAPDR